MLRNSSRSVLLSLLCRSRRPPTVSRCRRFFFSESSSHIVRPPPRPLTSRRPDQLTRHLPAAPWHQDRRKVAAATALAAAGVYAAARLRYGETVPFTGRTHLALLSHQKARERSEALFAEFKKEHAPKILGPNHYDTVRVQLILDGIIRAAHRGLALRQAKAAPTSTRLQEGLQWIDGLDWEVIIVNDKKINAECYPGAGKIVVHAGSLHHFGKDSEIAVSLSHEVGHVIARHTSGISNWLRQILEDMPILILIAFPFIFLSKVPLILPSQRRRELEADHIGIMLLAAAGIDPHIAVQVRQRRAEMEGDTTFKEYLKSTHPTSKKRWRCLSQPKVMDEAMELYKQVTSQ